MVSIFLYLFNTALKNILLAALSISLIFVVIGMIRYSNFDIQNSDLPYDEVITFEGEIVSRPEIDYKKQKIVVAPLDSFASNGKKIDNTGDTKILINANRYPKYKIGDIIKVEGELVEPGMIEDFDYGKYLKKDKIFAVVYQPESVDKIGHNSNIKYRLLNILYTVSESFEVALNLSLPEPLASLASGLILGIKRNIPDDFANDLRTTGLTHIIALSGFNVTIIVKVLSKLLSGRIGKKKAFWAGILLVLGFVIMTGGAASVVRAAIFSILILFSHLIGRKGNQTNIVLLALVIMILLNPYSLVLDIGLQLSFMAFAGIIYLSPLIEKYFELSRIKKLPEIVKSPLQETLSAQIMVLPLIVFYFGTLSLIAPLSNVLVLWIIPISMGLVFISGIVSIIYLPLGKIVALISWPALTYIVEMTKVLARLPFAAYQFENMNIVVPIVLYTVILYMMRRFAIKHSLKIIS